jgi:hypothetical protein
MMEAAERISGAEKLIGVFGYWSSFHDAEVVWLRLDRRPFVDSDAPTLEALIHAFEMTSEVGTDGCFVLRHHVLVHLRFYAPVGLHLEDFNHQNVLCELSISDIRGFQMERITFEVRFTSSFGMNASFQCERVEVVEIIPCTGDAVPLRGETEKH